jgi:hypothetical protein
VVKTGSTFKIQALKKACEGAKGSLRTCPTVSLRGKPDFRYEILEIIANEGHSVILRTREECLIVDPDDILAVTVGKWDSGKSVLDDDDYG